MRKLLQLSMTIGLALLISVPTWSQAAMAEIPGANEAQAHVAALVVANRTVLVFRGSLLGESPEMRAARARAVINEVLDDSTDLSVSL